MHLPNPAPVDAPFTKPAISNTPKAAGTTLLGLKKAHMSSNLLSGTATLASFGSMVQKG